jgi:hypothetical protein
MTRTCCVLAYHVTKLGCVPQAIEEPPVNVVSVPREPINLPPEKNTAKGRMRLAEKRHRERMNEGFEQLAVRSLQCCFATLYTPIHENAAPCCCSLSTNHNCTSQRRLPLGSDRSRTKHSTAVSARHYIAQARHDNEVMLAENKVSAYHDNEVMLAENKILQARAMFGPSRVFQVPAL